MSELLIDEPGRVALLLGNEGLVRGALKAAFVAANLQCFEEGMVVAGRQGVAA
jgi:hypothetical protein